MRVVIEIQEDMWEKIQEGYVPLGISKYLKFGTPLDDIKAEIEQLNPVDYGSMFSYESHNGAKDMKRDVLDIIDRHIGDECTADDCVSYLEEWERINSEDEDSN